MDITSDIIGSLDSPEERRARVQRAYDDGYQDGRLDIERELERRIAAAALTIVSLNDQVDYWRNEFLRLNAVLSEITIAEMSFEGRLVPINSTGMREMVDLAVERQAEVDRLTALLALQVEQADEAVDEAYEKGHNDCLDGNFS